MNMENNTSNKTLTGSDDNDSVKNFASNVKIYGVGGNDTVYNYTNASLSTISGGTGNDLIYNWATNVTVNGNDGNDTINAQGSAYDTKNVIFFGDAGDDELTNVYNTAVTMEGGAGNDTFINFGDKVLIVGGEGNDSVYSGYGYSNGKIESLSSGTKDCTIIGGTGDDSIHLNGASNTLIKYASGDGNDVVSGFNSDDTLEITSGRYTTAKSGSDLIVSVFGDESGKITLSGAANLSSVHISGNISSNENYISNSNSNTVINGTNENDTILNTGSHTTIFGSGGDDSIRNTNRGSALSLAGSYSYIYAGTGNDYVENYDYSDYSFVSGDSGNDTILSRAANSSIYGGYGNDSLRNITGEVLLSGGNGADTLVNNGISSIIGHDNTIIGGSGNDIISLGSSVVNDIIKYSSGDGDDIVYGLNSSSTLQIGGGNGTYSSKTSGSNVIVTVGSGKITLVGAANLSQLNISGTKKTVKEKNSWKLNGSVATYGTSSKTLATVRGAESKSGLTTSGKKITLKKTALSKKVTVSGSYEFDFASGYKNATISGTAKADTITARGTNLKIVGGKGKDSIKMVGTGQTVSGGAGADTFTYAADGGNEKILDFKSNDKLKIGEDGDGNYSTLTSGDNLIVSTDDGGKITLVGAANLSNVDIVGTKKTSGKGVKVSGNGKKITLTENFEDNSFSLSRKYSSAVTLDASEVLCDLSITGNNFSNRIIGTAQDDTIDGGAGADTIYGGDGNDSIFGGKGNDIIFGGIGKDTLWGGAGDDELYGDDGKDVFYYNAGEGNDTIFGYEATVDKIILASGTISNVTTDRNNNVIFSVGDGQIVVNNCADRTVKIVNSSGNIVKNGLYEP